MWARVAMPTGRGGLLNLFLTDSADERTRQCSIPVMRNENGFDSRGGLPVNPRASLLVGVTSKRPASRGAFHAFSKRRRCRMLGLRAQLWRSTKNPYVGIYATIFYVKSEKFFYFILFFKFPYRCGNLMLLLFTGFKHTSLNPMVEKCVDISPV